MKKLLSSLLFFAFVSLTGCSKNTDTDLSGEDQKVVSISLRNDIGDNTSTVKFKASAFSQEYDILPVTLAGGLRAEKDLHIVIEPDSMMVINYNSSHGTNFVVPASSQCSIVSRTVTILKGQNKAFLKINAKTGDFIGTTYALGFRIVSIDGGYSIAANGRNAGIAAFNITNSYEGLYLDSSITTRYSGSTVASGIQDQRSSADSDKIATITVLIR